MSVRWFLATVLGLAAVVAGQGCRHAAPPDEGVVVVDFWNGFSGPDGAQMEKIVRRFNQEHEGRIRVNMQIIPWGTFYDKVTLGLAFGGAPEVFVIHVNRFPEYAHHGVLGNLDDLAKQGGLDGEDFVEAAWEAAHWEGTLRALPLDCHPLGLYYNLDLFEKAGIARPPQSYDEFMDAARKLTRDNDGDGRPEQWGFAFTWLHSNSLCFLNQFGTGLLDESLKSSGLDTPEATAAMERMLDIVRAGVAPPPEGQDAWLGFQTGKVAMALEGVYMMTSLVEQKGLRFAAAPVPQFGPRKAVWAGTHLLAMPEGLDQSRRHAAWTFMTYLSENSLGWAEGGQVPVRKSVLNSPGFQRLEVQAQFAKQLDHVVYEPRSIYSNLIATFGDSAFEAILNGIQPTEQALETAARRTDNRLRKR